MFEIASLSGAVRRTARNDEIIMFRSVIASEAKQSGIDRQILTCLRLLRSAALCAAPLAMTRLLCLGPSLRAKRSNPPVIASEAKQSYAIALVFG